MLAFCCAQPRVQRLDSDPPASADTEDTADDIGRVSGDRFVLREGIDKLAGPMVDILKVRESTEVELKEHLCEQLHRQIIESTETA